MRYDYNPSVKNFIVKNCKNISIIILVLVIIFVFLSVNSVLTGFATYNEELKNNLSNYEIDLIILNQTLTSCTNSLKTYETDIQDCEKQKSELTIYSDALKNNLSICLAEKEAIWTNYTNMIESYKNLIRASVQLKCCSYDDVLSGTQKNWDIKDNKIICSGNYTVNCTSGVTNY